MTRCPACGHENGDRAKFCEECGVALALAAAPAADRRKVVTLLFCDVSGSTAMGERLDPESVREVMSRYFAEARSAIERHGGTVEKFAGDAVMAAFGVPTAHEDDAARACRAALEMRDRLEKLNRELASRYGSTLAVRIGINTGEVVAGDIALRQTFVTGDPVNVAARLEQHAKPGEILLGGLTAQLSGAAIEPVEPIAVTGKREPVAAYRLLSTSAQSPARRRSVRFIGRREELALLRESWGRMLVSRRCELVTITGMPGIGKSHLAHELLAELGARAVGGRCLPYGEGITYWPVVEVVKQLGAVEAGEDVDRTIHALLGEGAPASTDETAWAFGKLLEAAAAAEPLAVVFDDLQWGEETFLDLVEHVSSRSEAPILILCLARPELFERRPDWPATLSLEQLPNEDAERLLGRRLPDEMHDRVLRAAGGNPLFIEEIVAMVADGGSAVEIPSTLQELLAARLDLLDPPERRVLERAAVEGEIFHRGSVEALAPDEDVPSLLTSLARRDLIRPDRAHIAGDEGFRFRHLLVRDAAYAILTKHDRADLHERFGEWLEQSGAALVELDEILGYHLEQAFRYQDELARGDVRLAEPAARRLATAGRRALWRTDNRAAAGLLERALMLTRPSRVDVLLELDLAEALYLLDPGKAAGVTADAAERAASSGDATGAALARLGASRHRSTADPQVNELEALAAGLLPPLEEAADHAALVHVWLALRDVANFRGQDRRFGEAAEHALRHARLAGQTPAHLFKLETALAEGPVPADEALELLESLAPNTRDPAVLLRRAQLLAMLGRHDEAWPLAHAASTRLSELTGQWAGEERVADIAAYAGDYEGAAHLLRTLCDRFEAPGYRGWLSTYAPMLGRTLCRLGRHDEAESLARVGRELGTPEDTATQFHWRLAQALVHSGRGEHEEAIPLAREAVEILAPGEALNHTGSAFCDLAEVLRAAGHTDQAARAYEHALERYERKKNLAMIAQVRPRLKALRERTPASDSTPWRWPSTSVHLHA